MRTVRDVTEDIKIYQLFQLRGPWHPYIFFLYSFLFLTFLEFLFVPMISSTIILYLVFDFYQIIK